MSEIFNEVKQRLTMLQVAQHLGFEADRNGFIHTPFGKEKTPSCKLYQNSFYDFSSNQGGDLIYFASVVLGISNWEACRYLAEAFGLPVSLSGYTGNRRDWEQRRREQERQKQREQGFYAAVNRCVADLKLWQAAYKLCLKKALFTPFGAMEAWIYSQLDWIEYQLDILCCVDQSDQSAWVLDALEILEERNLFNASKEELADWR